MNRAFISDQASRKLYSCAIAQRGLEFTVLVEIDTAKGSAWPLSEFDLAAIKTGGLKIVRIERSASEVERR
ncbi:hypothetical protein MACH24_08550 [Erythrobacter sp. Dej080120_24]|nr:hypothetical protein MACH24_08550 [Erythrobacter sp. Dej080120_24]